MTDQHPITPPPELIAKWASSMCGYYEAARWGADQELDACVDWVSHWCPRWPDGTHPEDELRADRRPKPPSLKEQALALLDKIQGSKEAWDISDLNVVRRALEQLDD